MEEDPHEERSRPQPVEGLKKVEIDGHDKAVHIGATLLGKEAEALGKLLIEFKKLFAWKPNDMSGISKEKIAHELNIDPNIRSIAQKRCPVGEKKEIAMRQEIGK